MERAAHTAEHVFMRNLGSITNEMQVIKVEQDGEYGTITSRFAGLEIEQVMQAMRATNIDILNGARVSEHFFETIQKAREKFPLLRANEDRITPPVRVIEIEGIDWTACARVHSQNLSEARLFLVYNIRKAGGNLYTIDFVVGKTAITIMSELVMSARLIADILNCNPADSPKRLEDILRSLQEQKDINRKLTAQLMDGATVETIGNEKVLIYDLIDGDQSVINRKIGEAVTAQSVVALGLNSKGADGSLIVTLARSENIHNIDCAKLINRILIKYGGKGGGRANFAIGTAGNVMAATILRSFLEELRGEKS